ncbi:hypothetical protein GQ457_05G027970 [Hibiscus cannabinus]
MNSSLSFTSEVWKFVWTNLAPPKVEAFVWKLMHGHVPTKVELAKRGGVLRNHEGKILCTFSKNAGLSDASSIEILAIKAAVSIFKSSIWARSHKLIIECDSSNVVHWINNVFSTPVAFRDIVQTVLKSGVGIDWKVCVIPRKVNTMADNLAKRGISRVHDLIDINQS